MLVPKSITWELRLPVFPLHNEESHPQLCLTLLFDMVGVSGLGECAKREGNAFSEHEVSYQDLLCIIFHKAHILKKYYFIHITTEEEVQELNLQQQLPPAALLVNRISVRSAK